MGIADTILYPAKSYLDSLDRGLRERQVKVQEQDLADKIEQRKIEAKRRADLVAQFDDPLIQAAIYDPNFLMSYATLKKQEVDREKNDLLSSVLAQHYGINLGGVEKNDYTPPRQSSNNLELNPINNVTIEGGDEYDWTKDMQPNVLPDGSTVELPVDPTRLQGQMPESLPQSPPIAQPNFNRAGLAEMMGVITNDPLGGLRAGEDIRKNEPDYIGNVERIKLDVKSRRKLLDDTYTDATGIISGEPQIQVIESNLNDLVKRGASTGGLSNIASWLNATGQQVGLDFGLDSGSTLENISAATSQLAIPLAKQLGVNPTDFDYEQILKSIPNPKKSLAANFALVDLQKQNIVKQKGRIDLINSLDRDGATLPEIKAAIANYDKAYKIDVPKSLPNPNDNNSLKEGVRYYTNQGIVIWDGEKFNKVKQ